MFQFVKIVKEMTDLTLDDDYFNQRHISNKGDVYQLVQARLEEKANVKKPN